MKIVIEPSSAVPIAALLDDSLHVSGKRVGVILTGGNVRSGAAALDRHAIQLILETAFISRSPVSDQQRHHHYRRRQCRPVRGHRGA